MTVADEPFAEIGAADWNDWSHRITREDFPPTPSPIPGEATVLNSPPVADYRIEVAGSRSHLAALLVAGKRDDRVLGCTACPEPWMQVGLGHPSAVANEAEAKMYPGIDICHAIWIISTWVPLGRGCLLCVAATRSS